LIHVQGKDVTEILRSVKNGVELVGNMYRGSIEKRHVVLIINGETFTRIQAKHKSVVNENQGIEVAVTVESSILLLFLDLAATCDNVIHMYVSLFT
jgi:hypothetical protein